MDVIVSRRPAVGAKAQRRSSHTRSPPATPPAKSRRLGSCCLGHRDHHDRPQPGNYPMANIEVRAPDTFLPPCRTFFLYSGQRPGPGIAQPSSMVPASPPRHNARARGLGPTPGAGGPAVRRPRAANVSPHRWAYLRSPGVGAALPLFCSNGLLDLWVGIRSYGFRRGTSTPPHTSAPVFLSICRPPWVGSPHRVSPKRS